MKTTLNKIREYSPCTDGWCKLLTHLGKTNADDEPLAITTILDSNGLDDALWCLQAVEGYDREISLYAVWCARQVQHLTGDHRVVDALHVVERYANGEATEDELAAARDAVRAATWSAARSAADAATWDAARSAARSAADAAWAATWSAARSAAEAAAWDAAGSAAAAADAAAWDAARNARWSAAAEAARAKQEAELRRICEEVEG